MTCYYDTFSNSILSPLENFNMSSTAVYHYPILCLIQYTVIIHRSVAALKTHTLSH